MINFYQNFSAAVAKLAEDKTRFDLVVPNGQDFREKNYAGIFRFRFWRFGTWTEVVIDDRLPTHNGQLIYTSSKDQNEFWGALLEKAFAKWNGSYKAIESGKFNEGSVGLTGGIPETMNLTDFDSDKKLFKILKKAVDEKAFIGTSLKVSKTLRFNHCKL